LGEEENRRQVIGGMVSDLVFTCIELEAGVEVEADRPCRCRGDKAAHLGRLDGRHTADVQRR
jgi:hypothetical protein